ncbi:major tail protein [Lactococcus phage R31]|uniref:Neck passage structure protein n=2 Tax=Skunavirus R31 TaxID=2845461 RepID=A0A1W6JH17_9CAUD|nr:major tail protein [Lactococcus phage R31]ARM65514.1 neck passage structure protein [Lactococcus phage R3.4]ARM65563.1 neck passage structure protein [Lactococcus phage R31]
MLDDTTKTPQTVTIHENHDASIVVRDPKQLSEKNVTGSVYLDLTKSNNDAWAQLSTTNGDLSGNVIKAGQKGYSTFSGEVPTITDDNANIAIRRLEKDNDTTFDYSEMKVEEGSTATPWMPSASEAKEEDYPSHIGKYTDNNSHEQSTNPLKYAWSILKKVKDTII